MNRKMQTWLCGVLVLALLMAPMPPSLVSRAEVFGDFEYTVSGKGTVTVTGYNGEASVLTVPAEIDGKPVTAVGGWAFRNCESLVEVVLPEGITSIPQAAFQDCKNLECIALPESVTEVGAVAFSGCEKLATIALPAGLKTIEQNAFAYSGLEEITLPEGMTKVGNGAFSNCVALKRVTLPTTLTSVGGGTFNTCIALESIVLPEGIISIGTQAFYECTNLKEVTLPESLTFIGDSAFERCVSLQAVTVPAGVTTIESYAFYLCAALETVVLPTGVQRIGDEAFAGCESLQSCPLPESLTAIGAFAFNRCHSLTAVTIPAGVTEMGRGAFGGCHALTALHLAKGNNTWAEVDGCLYSPDKTTLLHVPGGQSGMFYVPEHTKTIAQHAFLGCVNLTGVTVPESVTTVDSYAFSGCTALQDIRLPNQALHIGVYAFNGTAAYANEANWDEGCVLYIGPHLITVDAEKLTGTYSVREGTLSIAAAAFSPGPACHNPSRVNGLILPDSLEVIGLGAFRDCTALHSLTIGKGIKKLPEYTFSGLSNLEEVIVPATLTDAEEFHHLTYKAHIYYAGSGAQWQKIGGAGISAAMHYHAASAADIRLGDVDGDGAITSTDARFVLQNYVGKVGQGTADLTAADVDSSGYVNSTDARIILQYYAGKLKEWP